MKDICSMNLEKMTKASPSLLGKHAIVIGAGIGGLLTARVLSDYFEQVTIFEADTLPDKPIPRQRVPQGNHGHALLAAGANVMRKYFPTLHNDILAAGGEYGDTMMLTRQFRNGRWNLRQQGGTYGYFLSRPLLESMVRKHTCSIQNVRLRTNEPVGGYLKKFDNNRSPEVTITGITLQKNNEPISADFVADVRGRSSTALSWLKQLGYKPPERTTIGIDLGYTTFEVSAPPRDQRDWCVIYTLPKKIPDGTRGGVIFRIERNRYLVTAAGIHKDYPPDDWLGFLEFLKGLSQPDIYEEVKDLRPIGSAQQYRYPKYLRNHYERLTRFPRRLIVLGDAICCFNPAYGQGMTLAAKEADHLSECLAKCSRENEKLDDLTLPFFKNISARIIDPAWAGATLQDFKYPQTVGHRPTGYKIATWLQDKLYSLAGIDREFAVALNKVTELVNPPTSLIKPKYLLKSIFKGL